jgi:hypothetical protein
MIIEYKLIMESGVRKSPSWVREGGYFHNRDDFTMVGITDNDDVRDYYLPDTIVRLNKQGLIDRVLAMHQKRPFIGPDGIPMSDSAVSSMVGEWCDDRGEA